LLAVRRCFWLPLFSFAICACLCVPRHAARAVNTHSISSDAMVALSWCECYAMRTVCAKVALWVRVCGCLRFAFDRACFRLLCTTMHLPHHSTPYTQHNTAHTPRKPHTPLAPPRHSHLTVHAAVHLTHTALTTHLPYLTQPLPPLALCTHTISADGQGPSAHKGSPAK
jgi:hypothetical protein